MRLSTAAFFLLSPVFALAQGSNGLSEATESTARPVARVYAETAYTLQIAKSLRKDETKDVCVMSGGSGFILQDNGSNYLVTAAHVVLGSTTKGTIIKDGKEKSYTLGETASLTQTKTRIRVGTLSLVPERLLVDPAADVAIMTLADADLRTLNLLSFGMHRARLRPEIQVRVWGFPSTVLPQFTDSPRVSAVEDDFFVLNQPIDSGFSGGPVLDAAGELIGSVVRTTEKQTRCVTTRAILRAVASFAATAKPYHD